MNDTVAIVQARMGSSRLPGKVLKEIGDEPMLWHVHERATCASLVDRVIIATSSEQEDDQIQEFCEERDIPVFRGSEEDVLDRYYRAASDVGADVIVRLTADCPLLSPPVIDRVIRTYLESNAEYVANILEYTHPDGLDVEAFSFSALKTAWEQAMTLEEREHVTVFLRRSDDFQHENVDNVIDMSQYSFTDKERTLRWTVDYPEDMMFVRQVYDRLTKHGHWVFDQQSVLELLERYPDLRRFNEDR